MTENQAAGWALTPSAGIIRIRYYESKALGSALSGPVPRLSSQLGNTKLPGADAMLCRDRRRVNQQETS